MLVWRDVSRSYCDCEVQKHCLSEQAPQSIFLTFIASNSHRSEPRIALLTGRRLRGYKIFIARAKPCAKGIRASSSLSLDLRVLFWAQDDGETVESLFFLLFSVMLVWRDVSRSYCDCEVQKHCLSEQAPQSIFLTFIASNSHRSAFRIALLTGCRLRGYKILLLGLCPAHKVSARAQAVA